jgi:sigma-54 specific flagellar transcriptional regulator A
MDAGLIALDAAAHDETEYNKNAEDEVTRVIALAQGGSELPEEGMELKQHLLRIERHLIQQALERAEGNVSKTARLLSLQRTTLIEKINKYDLSNSY